MVVLNKKLDNYYEFFNAEIESESNKKSYTDKILSKLSKYLKFELKINQFFSNSISFRPFCIFYLNHFFICIPVFEVYIDSSGVSDFLILNTASQLNNT